MSARRAARQVRWLVVRMTEARWADWETVAAVDGYRTRKEAESVMAYVRRTWLPPVGALAVARETVEVFPQARARK